MGCAADWEFFCKNLIFVSSWKPTLPMAQGPFEQVGGLQALLEKPLKAIKVFHFSTFKDQVCAFAVGPDSLVQKTLSEK